jgi:hypothetical protein
VSISEGLRQEVKDLGDNLRKFYAENAITADSFAHAVVAFAISSFRGCAEGVRTSAWNGLPAHQRASRVRPPR